MAVIGVRTERFPCPRRRPFNPIIFVALLYHRDNDDLRGVAHNAII